MIIPLFGSVCEFGGIQRECEEGEEKEKRRRITEMSFWGFEMTYGLIG
jgi:hypothetical protein